MFELAAYLEFEKKFENTVKVEFHRLFSESNFQQLSRKFLEFLDYYKNYHYLELSADDAFNLNIFVENFLDFFTRNNFIIPENHLESYLKFNSLISNLVFLTPNKTTDSFISGLLNNHLPVAPVSFSRNTMLQLMVLFSVRNKIEPDYKMFFSIDPEAASFWYWQYFNLADFTMAGYCENIKNHIDNIFFIDENAVIPSDINGPFFYSTYGDPGRDKKVKQKINSIIQDRYQNIKIYNPDLGPKPSKIISKKIAVISGFFYESHSVFRSTYKYIEALAADYELTLINFSGTPYSFKPNIFKNEIQLKLSTDSFDLSKIPADFSLACFIDIGMTVESVFLANMRLAPIQVNCHGHSVSSHGAEIDYFISGIKSEIINKAEENYSERLVLLPGTGLYPLNPEEFYHKKVSSFTLKAKNKDAPFLIACPWSFIKINHSHLQSLLKIKQLADKKIVYRFFPSSTIYSKIFSFCLQEELFSIFGQDSIEIMEMSEKLKYLEMFEQTDLLIDSFHFGGYNTVIDSLFLGKPLITIDGDKAYNKFAAGMLKTLKLEELVAIDSDDYVQKVVKLINDDEYRLALSEKIKKEFILNIIVNDNEPLYFKKAIDLLIAKHDDLKKENQNGPIFIK